MGGVLALVDQRAEDQRLRQQEFYRELIGLPFETSTRAARQVARTHADVQDPVPQFVRHAEVALLRPVPPVDGQGRSALGPGHQERADGAGQLRSDHPDASDPHRVAGHVQNGVPARARGSEAKRVGGTRYLEAGQARRVHGNTIQKPNGLRHNSKYGAAVAAP